MKNFDNILIKIFNKNLNKGDLANSKKKNTNFKKINKKYTDLKKIEIILNKTIENPYKLINPEYLANSGFYNRDWGVNSITTLKLNEKFDTLKANRFAGQLGDFELLRDRDDKKQTKDVDNPFLYYSEKINKINLDKRRQLEIDSSDISGSYVKDRQDNSMLKDSKNFKKLIDSNKLIDRTLLEMEPRELVKKIPTFMDLISISENEGDTFLFNRVYYRDFLK